MLIGFREKQVGVERERLMWETNFDQLLLSMPWAGIKLSIFSVWENALTDWATGQTYTIIFRSRTR